ncbi:hypothetical protein C8A05DRAFT_40180, partial [Staphylotrichum tortipilum]
PGRGNPPGGYDDVAEDYYGRLGQLDDFSGKFGDNSPHQRSQTHPHRGLSHGNRFTSEESTGSGASVADLRIKRDDLGVFNPTQYDPDDAGMVTKGKITIYTDVHVFVEAISTLTEDDPTGSISQNVAQFFPTIIQSTAFAWWNGELTMAQRGALRNQGLPAMLQALSRRFAPDKATATRRYKDSVLTLRDLAGDPQALPRFIGKKMRWARVMGLAGAGNTNWEGAMTQIYGDMDLAIQRTLDSPARSASFEDYMRVVDETRPLLFQSAQAEYAKKSSAFNHSKSDDRFKSFHLTDNRPKYPKPFEK